MPVNHVQYQEIVKELVVSDVTLVAVSKTKPAEDIQEMMALGQLDFGENYVQELQEKQSLIQPSPRWHFIGHLQTNKVKIIVPFVHLIHSVDSLKLLKEINKQAEKINRTIDCLLQVHIAQENTKFGMNEAELGEVLDAIPFLPNINVKGLMGMASLTTDDNQVRSEYRYLKGVFCQLQSRIGTGSLSILSMGMSGDYKIAVEEGSTMVRIGSLLFGERNYNGSK